MTGVEVEDGMNGGVGDWIIGRGDDETAGVVKTRGIFPPLHAPSRRISANKRITFLILGSYPGYCSRNFFNMLYYAYRQFEKY
jgi:hypothetical protein